MQHRNLNSVPSAQVIIVIMSPQLLSQQQIKKKDLKTENHVHTTVPCALSAHTH